jgi:hypothetical protein
MKEREKGKEKEKDLSSGLKNFDNQKSRFGPIMGCSIPG